MRTILVVLACIMMFGCAHSRMQFQLAQGTTQDDFQRAKIDCGEDAGGGGFIFGPAVIVVGVIATVESIKYAKKNKFQDCMENKGFKCEIFYTLKEAQVLIEEWRREYNTFRPHSSLKYRPPAPEAWLH